MTNLIEVDLSKFNISNDEKNVEEKIKQGITKLTLEAEKECKNECPVDTGNLMNSIASEISEDEGEVKTDVEYAPYVIYGTSKMEANDFPERAKQTIEPQVKELMGFD